MATSPTPVDQDYATVTTACGILDAGAMGKLALTGDQAREFLAGQVSNDTESLTPGSGCYAALLDNKGKMLGDLRVLYTPDGGELLLVCERVALQALFDVLRRSIVGWRAELHKRTVQQALFSLVGPAARAVAAEPGLPAPEHASGAATMAGHPVLLVATALGVDVVCEADAGPPVHEELLARGAVVVDEAAVELRRVETGRPRYGADLDGTVIPQEAGLNDRAVSFTKGCYVGQETVARLYYRGKPNRRLCGIALDAPAEPGDEVHALDAPDGTAGRRLGAVTSAAVSPRHGPIALAFVRREAALGDTVRIGAAKAGRLVALPFGGDPEAP